MFEKLSKKQQTLVLFAASRLLGSCWGMGNEGLYLITGQGGIPRDKKEGAEFMLRALKRGAQSQSFKKHVDFYFQESEQFRKRHPEYQVWNGFYESFTMKKIKLL